MTPANPLAGVQQNEQQSQQELIKRLLGRIAQPRKVGPQPQPEQVRSMTPQQPDSTHGLVRNLFGLIQSHAAKAKQAQLDHATARIKSISDAITDAYEVAEGDDAKAKEIFNASPAVTSLMSKEGQKDMKQMEKLLQYDFLNPEKSKTVWHEALERVAKVTGAEKTMKGIRTLMGQHKDKMAEEVRKQGEAQKSQTEARSLADTMFKGARPQQMDASKMLPSLISSGGADLRQREREMFQDYERQMKQQFSSSIDSIKDPRVKEIARGLEAMHEGDEEGANKIFAQASKAYAASQKPGTMNLNKAISDLGSDDPKVKDAAQKWVDNYQRIQKSILMDRGLSFGMGRLYNWYNAESGETAPMNGFQAQAAMQKGEQWIMTSPISPQQLLPAQQIVRTMLQPGPEGKSLRDELISDMDAFDNASDRAIISRVLRENPAAYNQDVSTLGIWLDQNLTDKLSEGGQKLVRDLKLYAEVFNRSAAVTGQTRTEMNTVMLLALLPSERTPNKGYAMQQLQSSFNYLDGVVQAPLLGGAKFKGGTKPPTKPDTAKPSEPTVIDLDKPN